MRGHLKVNDQLEPAFGSEYGVFVETISADTTLTVDDNGKIFILYNATGENITLPALASGLKFKFIVGLAFGTSNWVISSSEGDNISGVIADMGSTVAGVVASAEDQINFVASAETVGDWIELVADEENGQWIVSGMCGANGGITATDPS